MKKYILMFAFSFVTIFANAQTPTWQWLKRGGGNGDDGGNSIAVDAHGNTYITGSFSSSAINFGTITLTNNHPGNDDMYIVKYNANGTEVWAKSGGGNSYDIGYSITVDTSGNSYVTGYFESPNITFGSITLVNSGINNAIFIVKYNANGTVLWAKSAGGVSYDKGFSIAVDGTGNCYVTGGFMSPSINFGSTTLANTNSGGYEMFIVKYDSNGSVLWAQSTGGTSNSVGSYYNYGNSIAVDIDGNSYVIGQFYGSDITFGGTTLSKIGGDDMFIVKYDANGIVVWAKRWGGIRGDDGSGIAVDGSGNLYVTGFFYSPSIIFGNTTLTNAGGIGYADVFIVKYDTSGNEVWAKRAGDSDNDHSNGIAIDGSGNSYVAGFFNDSIINFGSTTLPNAGSYDMFVVKYDANGAVRWAKAAGGSSLDYSWGIAVDGNGNSYVVGSFASPSINFGSSTLTSAGGSDVFIAKLAGSTVGINENEPEKYGVSIYPNPFKSQTAISFTQEQKNIIIKITDVLAKEIKTINFTGWNLILDSSDLNNGIYFINIKTEQGIISKKLIIQN